MPAEPDDDRRVEAALIAGGIAATMVAGSVTTGLSTGGRSKWVSASRAASKRGVRIEGKVGGWRRGIGSE